jgi:hypothetical protein
VLHTWSQEMLHHPHLHCLVPAGGLSIDRSRWIACRGRFFLPVAVLKARFRRRFLRLLATAYRQGKLRLAGRQFHSIPNLFNPRHSRAAMFK